MELTFNEAVEMLEDGTAITLESDGGSYDIDLAHNFIGRESMDGYISEVLGNIVYSSAKAVLKESIDHLESCGETVNITI